MATKRRALAERRRTVGLSQERLAEALRVEPSTVGRWERGETAPQPWFRPKLARALGVSHQALAKLLKEGSESSDPETPALAIPALGPDERHHIAAALGDARRYLDADVVAAFKHQLEACAADDGARGPAQTLPTVLGILAAVERQAREVPPAVRCQLLSAGSLGAEFAGWLYRDLHSPQRAGFWYGRATEWAQEAGDTAAQGYILLKKSQMAYDDRDALRVLTWAQAAQYGPWPLSKPVRAEVTQQEARGLAMLGEPISIIEQKLDDARRLLADATPGDESHTQIGSPYSEHTLTLRNASCYIEAGKPRRAASLYADVLAADHLSPRDRGYFTARMASALALAGEPDEAAGAGLDAAQLATATASQRTKRELTRALATLTPWQNRPGPRALREAVVVSPERS
jgi:transcriptional regulator with XRE-family HTH domain